ncbi:MLX-interacting protein isoform X1 [Rana temporaria]|uniref:MLX-interacting protein isoform X1 n=1 Tax=Rana temporaria TaxID=8407 RepID=UPI001AAC9538|nr:MLX-interacting protein isoform X1 [Rana temporaria]
MMMAMPMRLSHAACAMVKQEPDDDSDTDEPNLLLKKSDSAEPQIIHSGHFMVSSPHSEHPPKKGYDFDTVNEQACQTYSGKTSTCHLSIDASLTKLLECMTLAYSGKLVSPKWKNFKGLKLQWRDKIRLNNAIWRAWYMQYRAGKDEKLLFLSDSNIEKRQNPVCHFVTPLDASIDFDEHRRPEAIATEGRYWKRRIEIVVREYHKWRTYFKKRLQKHRDEDLSSLVKDDDLDAAVPMEEEPLLDMEMLMAEFSDTLFSTIYSHQHNPKEIEHSGNADMIQPELFPLQPNLDLMDTFESFQDLFSGNRLPSSLFTSASSVPAVPLPDPALHSCNQTMAPPGSPSSNLAPVNLDEELIPSPGPPSMLPRVPEVRRERASSLGNISTVHGPVKFNSDTSINNNQHGFVPVCPPPVTIFQTPPGQQTLSRNPRLAPQPSFVSRDADKFHMCNASVITHTASATLTHNPSATTFSQSQNLILTTQRHVPCNISVQTAGVMQQTAPQTHGYFTISSSGAKQKKQPPKIVPAPQQETVSLLFTPASFSGQTQAVIVSPASLKSDTMLAPRITQSSVVIAPAGLTRSSGVSEFHGSILVGPAQRSQGTQKSQSAVSRLFSSPTQDMLVKREMSSSQNCSTAPSPSSYRVCHRSRRGSPCASEHSLSPPQSSGKTSSDSHCSTSKNERLKHISAEQKRRFNIKIAFNTLHSFVSSSSKPISHAITLQKTVEYIAKLQQERSNVLEETRRLREEVEELNIAINSCQQQLPATGVPITPQRTNHMRDLYDKYVQRRTIQNWKFWIFSIIIKPLFDSFNDIVSTASIEELYSTTVEWLEHHCSLPALRPMVLSTLRHLSTTTSILTDPSSLPEQAKQAVSKNSNGAGGT